MCLHARWPDLVGMESDELQEKGEGPGEDQDSWQATTDRMELGALLHL